MTHDSNRSVNIRPTVSILSVLRHLNYKPWFAVAEFVDNSLQSFLANQKTLASPPYNCKSLTIEITYFGGDTGYLSVRDNAAGISLADFPRAFRPAQVPPDTDGLSEFGMGMKSAACWFARVWTVKTKALNEQVCRVITFNVDSIVTSSIDEVIIEEHPSDPNDHFTEVRLTSLYTPPQGRSVGKIKEHLSSIYRYFLRSGILTLRYNGEVLTYSSPSTLFAPDYRKPDDPPENWRKEISFDFGNGLSAKGFAAIRAIGSTSSAGFSLFRRQRLIMGSCDDTYRPEAIFGSSNSYRYQRIFGELELSGFEVSHTKDGFKWHDNEEVFLQLLKEHLSEEPLNLLAQSENYRSRINKADHLEGAKLLTDALVESLSHQSAKIASVLSEPEQPSICEQHIHLTPAPYSNKFTIPVNGLDYTISIDLHDVPKDERLVIIETLFEAPEGRTSKSLGARILLNTGHAFMARHWRPYEESLRGYEKLFVSLAIAKLLADSSKPLTFSYIISVINRTLTLLD